MRYLTFRNVFILGLLAVIGVTFNELIREVQFNFNIFRDATLMFWQGESPYGDAWWQSGQLDYFLYPPFFNILFTPFAFLPTWIGAFAWNLTNYLLLVMAIRTFPVIDMQAKAKALLYSLPIIAISFMSFQYNIAVLYLFLFAFTLLERDKAHWAVLLIMISAMTKVYGVLELSLLLFYPRFWRNMGYALLFGAIIFIIPLVAVPLKALIPLYQSMLAAITAHSLDHHHHFESFFNIGIIFGNSTPSYIPYIQIAILGLMLGIAWIKRSLWSSYNFRVAALAAVMGYCAIFGNSTEKHTFVIAIVGYLMWYWSLKERFLLDKVLYWANLVVLVLMPVDLICPPVVMKYFFNTLDLNQWIFLTIWLTIIYRGIIGASNYGRTISGRN